MWKSYVIGACIGIVVWGLLIGFRRRDRSLIPPEPPSEASAIALARAGRKIQAIKMVRELSGMPLAEAKAWVEAAVPAPGQVPTAPPPPLGSPMARFGTPTLGGDEQALDLARQGRQIEAIKMIRQLHGVGLKEAKDWVDKAVRNPDL